MLNSTHGVFNPYILIGTCPMRVIGTCLIADSSRVEPTIFFMEIFFFETFLLSFLWAILHSDCQRSLFSIIFAEGMQFHKFCSHNKP